MKDVALKQAADFRRWKAGHQKVVDSNHHAVAGPAERYDKQQQQQPPDPDTANGEGDTGQSPPATGGLLEGRTRAAVPAVLLLPYMFKAISDALASNAPACPEIKDLQQRLESFLKALQPVLEGVSPLDMSAINKILQPYPQLRSSISALVSLAATPSTSTQEAIDEAVMHFTRPS